MKKELSGRQVVSISIDKKVWQKTRELGKKEGMSATVLVRIWMKEGLERYKKKGTI